MIKKLINPYKYLAGLKSLILGIAIILATSIIGYFSNTQFPDIISVKTCPDFSISYFILQGLLNWFILSTMFYIASMIISKSKVRPIDIYGTQALARFPYLLASCIGFSSALNDFSKYLQWTLLKQGEPIEISSIQIVIAILILVFSLILTIWMITLMFNAFKVSANLKGNRLVFSFIIVMILSIVLTGYLNQNLTLKLQ